MKVILPFSVIFVMAAAIFVVLHTRPLGTDLEATPSTAAVASSATSTSNFFSTSTPVQSLPVSATSSVATTTPKKQVSKPKNKPVEKDIPPAVQVERVELPYTTPPQNLNSYDTAVRASLVNILCMPHGGTLRPISGSGVVIDPRGVILTNAHVAQYVLLTENQQINLECTIRSGSPAVAKWKAKVLYIPSVWVQGHHSDVNASKVVGTGEHDYALLLITSDMQGNALTSSLPYIPADVREHVAFEGDNVLGAGYPAEFAGGIVAQQGLYAVTSVSSIKQLLTFVSTTVDVFSIGGVIEAQGGSSGGPVVNAWGYVVGIISTTSEGATTAERDLHALTLDYINRDISEQTGRTLFNFLEGDVQQRMEAFSRETAPGLIQKYVDYLSR